MYKRSIMLLYFVMSNITISQSLFSLHIKDQWVYRAESFGHSPSFPLFEVIGDTTFENGEKYFRFNRSLFELGNYVGADSQYIYCYRGKRVSIFNLVGNVGDVAWPNYEHKRTTITKIDTMTIFGHRVKTISYLLEMFTIEKATIAEKYGVVSYSYYDDPPAPWPSFTYTLESCTIDGIDYGNKVSIEQAEEIPNKYLLLQNYPNPFNPVTNIKFVLNKSADVKLIVYDILGRVVEKLLDEHKSTGIYEIQFNGSRYSSGVYFYCLTTDESVITKKFVLLK